MPNDWDALREIVTKGMDMCKLIGATAAYSARRKEESGGMFPDRHLIGTGPFKCSSYRSRGELMLRGNDAW